VLTLVPRLLVIILALAIGAHPPAVAQMIQVAGGYSTLFGAQGGEVTIQNPNSKAVMGAGFIGGQFAYGAALQAKLGAYDLIAGDNPIPVNLPTDVFDNIHYFAARGIGISTTKRQWHIATFGGVTANSLSTPFFPASKADSAAGLVYLDRPLTNTLHFYSVNILSQKQTSIQGVDWNLGGGALLSGAAGVGSNQPYAAVALTVKRTWLWARIGYVYEGDRFRRVTVQSPINAEVDKGNVLIVANPFRRLSLTGGYQHLLQPQQNPKLPFIRATLSQLQVSGDAFGFRLGGGLFASQQAKVSNLGQVLWASRKFTSWLDTGVQYYRNESSTGSKSSMLSARVRESVWKRVSILQIVNHSTQTTFGFGGSVESNRLSFDVDYSTVYIPFGNAQFRQSLGFSIRFRPVESVTLNAQSYVTSDGQTKYSISAAGSFFGSLPFVGYSGQISGGVDKYIIRGRVVDTNGMPIDGAAIGIDDSVLLTNSLGEFFVRTKHLRRYRLDVRLEEFVNPAPFEVYSAPVEVRSSPEASAAAIEIVLKPKGLPSRANSTTEWTSN